MQETRNAQITILHPRALHALGDVLSMLSDLLDVSPLIFDCVEFDFRVLDPVDTGALLGFLSTIRHVRSETPRKVNQIYLSHLLEDNMLRLD